MKSLNISCLASCYLNTNPKELYFSLISLYLDDFCPKQTLLVIDGPIKKKVREVINYFIDNYKIDTLEFKINKGLGIALAEGLKRCNYELIARFDTDDINLPCRLKNQFDFFVENPDLTVLGSSVLEFRKNGNSFENRLKMVPFNTKEIKLNSFFRNFMNHPSVMFKKSIIFKIGNYRNRLFFEDYDLWLRLLDKGYLFSNFKKPLIMMHRNNAALRRGNFEYVLKELKFIFNLDINLIKKIFVIFLSLIKILLKLILSAKIINIVPWRTSWKLMDHDILTYLELLEKKYKEIF